MLTRFLIFLFSIHFFFISNILNSQELQCRVQISTPGLHERDREIMQTLRSDINEFINQRNWTNYKFEPNERIEATIVITIEEKDSDEDYKGTIQVQSRRPIFSSSYSSPVLNIRDRDFQFTYRENDPLEYSDNTYTSNITSVIAYYAYIIIGFDFDTFSAMGGTPYFERAQNVVNLAQNSNSSGWRSQEGYRNRYWLVENLLNSQYQPIREAMYKYHRLGFDTMIENMDLARDNITESLELLRRAHRQRPGSYLMQVIMTAKNDELVNIYSEAPNRDQNSAIDILTEIDPSNSDKYRGIQQ